MLPNNIPGQEEGPTVADHWKRAVYRPAPSRFNVEMLPPVKLGGNYNFHMRICPITRGDRSSVSSRGSHTEYEILRRWEDCLIFQDTLEREYSRLAFSKRQRLMAGKGVRKNGIYLHGDRASSWESLPPGPEPDSVAQDIHDLVPALTKRGTMFRASQATTDQRQAELTAFISALLAEDVPTLLHDFRKEREVTDFFAFWRRDQDIQQKAAKKSPTYKPRSSVTSSIFSSYFSSTGESPVESPSRRERALSSASSDSSSIPSTGSARSSISVQITVDDEPVPFGHNPLHGSGNLEPPRPGGEFDRKPSFRGGKFLAAVAKRSRKDVAEDSQGRQDPPRPDSRASNATTVNQHPHRESWQTTASGMTFLQDLHLTLPSESNEDSHSSRMSMASIATFRTEVSAEGIVPRYYIPEPNPARLSTASFMTDVSADAIIPRSSRRPETRATLTRGPHRESTASYASDGDAIDEYFFDAFPRPCSFVPEVPVQVRPETPKMSPQQPTTSPSAGNLPRSEATRITQPASPARSEINSPITPEFPVSPNFLRRKQALVARAPSPSASLLSSSASVLSDTTVQSSFSDSTGSTITPSVYSFYSARSDFSSTTAASASSASSSSKPLVIKAAHNNAIILLRAEEDLSLSAIRHRLRDKFLGQEGITLPEKFALAYMIPASPMKATAGARGRGNSISSTGTLQDTALMEMVSTEEEWARLSSSLDGAKLTLRVVDPAA